MNRFYGLGLLALTLASCYHMRVENVPIYWLYPWDRDARKMVRAVIEEDVELIEELVRSGRVDVNMNARDDDTRFLFIATLLQKKQSYVKLLDLGADIHWGYIDHSPIYYAAGYFAEVAGDLYYLEEALKRGLDPSARSTSSGGSPIFFPLKPLGHAAKGTMPENYLAKLKLLISYGADLSLPSIGPSEKYPSGRGGNVVVYAAGEGYFNAVYYLLTEFEGIQYKDFKNLNVKTNEYWYSGASLLKEVERIANADRWGWELGMVQESTYPWFLKTVEWLENQGEVLDIPEDLSHILTIKLDTTQEMKHYKIDKHGNITPMDEPPRNSGNKTVRLGCITPQRRIERGSLIAKYYTLREHKEQTILGYRCFKSTRYGEGDEDEISEYRSYVFLCVFPFPSGESGMGYIYRLG